MMVTVDDVGALEMLELVCVPGAGVVPVMLRRFPRRDRRMSVQHAAYLSSLRI